MLILQPTYIKYVFFFIVNKNLTGTTFQQEFFLTSDIGSWHFYWKITEWWMDFFKNPILEHELLPLFHILPITWTILRDEIIESSWFIRVSQCSNATPKQIIPSRIISHDLYSNDRHFSGFSGSIIEFSF